MAWINPDTGRAFGSGGTLSASTFSNAGGAVSDIFGAFAAKQSADIKAFGARSEAESYDIAGGLAENNAQYADSAARIKAAQEERELYKTIGGQEAGVAGAGFAEGGSAGDLLRESASQGALAHALLLEQGAISSAGYQEQADSYKRMSETARWTATKEEEAGTTAMIGGVAGGLLKGAAAIAPLMLGA